MQQRYCSKGVHVVLPDSFGLERLNAATAEEAQQVFLACCSSPRWATAMEPGGPYADAEAVYAAGDAALAALCEDDIADALAGTPGSATRPRARRAPGRARSRPA